MNGGNDDPDKICWNGPEVLLALQTLELADAHAQGIDTCINENSTYDLNQIYNAHPDNPVIAALYLQNSGSVETIERKILTGDLGEVIYPLLLACGDNRESESDLNIEILQSCISSGFPGMPDR